MRVEPRVTEETPLNEGQRHTLSRRTCSLQYGLRSLRRNGDGARWHPPKITEASGFDTERERRVLRAAHVCGVVCRTLVLTLVLLHGGIGSTLRSGLGCGARGTFATCESSFASWRAAPRPNSPPLCCIGWTPSHSKHYEHTACVHRTGRVRLTSSLHLSFATGAPHVCSHPPWLAGGVWREERGPTPAAGRDEDVLQFDVSVSDARRVQ
jgi:hypothetical protein